MKQQRKPLALAAALIISVANLAAIAQQQTLDRTEGSGARIDAGAACANLDQDSVGKWFDVDCFGASQPATRVVHDHVPWRFESV